MKNLDNRTRFRPAVIFSSQRPLVSLATHFDARRIIICRTVDVSADRIDAALLATVAAATR